jgi:hypothetical protein
MENAAISAEDDSIFGVARMRESTEAFALNTEKAKSMSAKRRLKNTPFNIASNVMFPPINQISSGMVKRICLPLCKKNIFTKKSGILKKAATLRIGFGSSLDLFEMSISRNNKIIR